MEEISDAQIKREHIAGRYKLITGVLSAAITASATLIPTLAKINDLNIQNKNLISENNELSTNNAKLQTEKEELVDKNKKLSSSKSELQKENKKLVSDAEIHMEGIRVLLKNVTGDDYTDKDIKVIETDNEIMFATGETFIWAD